MSSKRPIIWKTTATSEGANDLIDQMLEDGYRCVSREDHLLEHRLGFEYVGEDIEDDEYEEVEMITIPKADCKIILEVFDSWFDNVKLKRKERKVWEELYRLVESNANGNAIDFEMDNLTDIYQILDSIEFDDKPFNKKVVSVKKIVWNSLDKDSKMFILNINK